MTRDRSGSSINGDALERLKTLLEPCALCPRLCGAGRMRGNKGFCGASDKAVICGSGPHFGEESVLVGAGGSGTIFFSGCNLGCVYCQNCDISSSRPIAGRTVTTDKLARLMLDLQNFGCANVNFVSPTHFAPMIAEALCIARSMGLTLPAVYNTGGYDSAGTLELLEGFMQIYMPDMKYSNPETAERLSAARDYPEVNRAAVKEMHRQVGELRIQGGLATGGLLVRHLVLPANLAGSFKTIDFLAEEVSPHTAINVMDQYRPCFKAHEYEHLNRRPTPEEYRTVLEYAIRKGLRVIC